MHQHIWVQESILCTCVCVCMYAFMYVRVCMYVCMYVRMCVLVHMRLYMYVNAPRSIHPYVHFFVFGVSGIKFLSANRVKWQGSGVCRQPYQANAPIVHQIRPQLRPCTLLLMRYNTNKWRGWYRSEDISALRKRIKQTKFSNDIYSHIQTRGFLLCLNFIRSYSNTVYDILVDFCWRSHQN